jgi:tetratricopeptide (TPR) repeat protein
MKQSKITLTSAFRLVIAATLLITSSAQADEYSDVNQLIRADKFAEAAAKADAYLVAKPRDPQMRFLKGVIQRSAGKSAEAIFTFTKLTEDFPELPEPYNNLAVLYSSQGQFEKARTALEMAIRTNPSYATAHENLGDIYSRLASQAYNSALQIDANSVGAAPKLAIIKEVFKANLKVPPTASTSIPVAPVISATPKAVTPLPTTPAPTAPIPAGKPAVMAAVPVQTAVTAPAAPPPPAQIKPVISDKASKDVEAALNAWAKAWEAKDMANYLGAYGKEFVPPGKQTRAVWEQERKKRILGKSNIVLKIQNLTISVSGNKASAKFRQDYRANSLSVSSRKTLDMVKIGEQWFITKESTGN